MESLSSGESVPSVREVERKLRIESARRCLVVVIATRWSVVVACKR